MRDIKFRGYDIIGKKWVYGDLVHNMKVTQTGLEPRTMVGGYEVAPETVGEFTGLHDMNGREIYEGDILRLKEPNGSYSTCHVEMCHFGYWAVSVGINEKVIAGLVDKKRIEVIGNIHDKPVTPTSRF